MDGDFQERNRAIAEFLADVAIRRRFDDSIEHITENGARVLRRDAASLVDTSFEDLIHPGDRATLEELWITVARDGTAPATLRMLRSDARTVYIQGTALRYLDDSFVFFGRDVTAQHLEAEELRGLAERFTTVADSVPAMLWMTSANGNTDFVNRAVVEFLEGHVEHDRETWAQNSVHPEDRERLNRVVTDAVEKIEPFNVEARVLNGRGEYRWLHMKAQPRFGPEGDFAGHVGVSIDITSSKLADESMRRAEGLTAMANLATGIAHEINDPLTAIRTAAEVALEAGERCKVGHAVEQSLKRVLAQAERATRITRDVLRFARSDDVSAELTDLNELVREVVEQISPNVRATQATLGYELDPKLPLLRLRRGELILAIGNLIQNAVDSSERPVFVQVRTELRKDRALLWVLDDGDGISEESLTQLFDPFFTTRRRKGSVGLGLSLVHRIVLDHGGAIEVQSTLDGGTAFAVVLPLEDPARA